MGDPGSVAAADIAFAKAVREDGERAAFDNYAAGDAVVHDEAGLVPAMSWLAGQGDGHALTRRSPSVVWSSCDGTLAVSFGRYLDAGGIVGSYVTVWELQERSGYRWTYDLRAADNPQPPPPPPQVEPDEDTIIVTQIDSIEGKVADCTRAAGSSAPPVAASDSAPGSARSRDGSLQWRWEHGADGQRRVVVDYLREGSWQQALDFSAPPAPGS
ncbi:hypothetical protein GCM10009127_04410 [Alteraurantiacibacter aestuarii]